MFERITEAFKTVFDFSSSRSWPAAFGFYLFYLVGAAILAIIFSAIAWGIAGVHDREAVYGIATKVGHIVGGIYSTAIYAMILYRKNMWQERWPVVGFILTPILGGVLSVALGLIPSAVVIAMEGNYRRIGR